MSVSLFCLFGNDFTFGTIATTGLWSPFKLAVELSGSKPSNSSKWTECTTLALGAGWATSFFFTDDIVKYHLISILATTGT